MKSDKSIPIVDLTEAIFKGDLSQAAEEIGSACREWGFFYVSGHGVRETLIDELSRAARGFFSYPVGEKMRIDMVRGGRAWRGYFPVGRELTSGAPDAKEGLYFGTELDEVNPLVAAGTPMHGRNQWPDSLPRLRDLVLSYMEEMLRLGGLLMEAVGISLGLEQGYFRSRYSDSPLSLFRIFNYPPGAGGWGVGEHTDYGYLTLLWQDDSAGLEVKTNGHWIAAPPVPGTLVCNLGDMLERLTAGEFLSTPHRVRNDHKRDRISMPFFFDPGFNSIVEPLPRPVQSQIAERWDGANVYEFKGTYGDYLLGKVSRVFPELFSSLNEHLTN